MGFSEYNPTQGNQLPKLGLRSTSSNAIIIFKEMFVEVDSGKQGCCLRRIMRSPKVLHTHPWEPCQGDHHNLTFIHTITITASQIIQVYMEGQNMNLPRIKTKSKIVQQGNEQLKNSRVGGWEGQAMAVNKEQLLTLTCHMT